ncbi:MAG: hypothetical protein Q4D09_05605 [Clostridia bacterium]|nr:hypothetical protein [Clostridia bacterium]
MAKKISIFLAALMVLTLFTAVAIAAVNGASCPECGGDVSVSYSSPYGYTFVGTVPCSNHDNKVDRKYRYYIDCYENCSGCGSSLTTTSTYYEIVCNHPDY